jgi:tryptophanyl-tRNA synthetase
VAERRIFSGIQPTGRKHLGNYIGAIRQYVVGQDSPGLAGPDDAIYCIVDLHAITVAYDPAELRERVHDTAALLLAAGLDPARCILFRQGDVEEHTELCWLLTSVTAVGELNRMHQFRDKSLAQRELVSAGLLFYPVLQAADVLAYRAHEVPVGEDQREHLELMRDVAERFNSRFGETLVVPRMTAPTVGARVRDLQDPTKKMSKSASSAAGLVEMLDDPKVSAKKIRSAVTDSGSEVRFDEEEKPGISNLLTIYSAISGDPIAAIEEQYRGRGYGDFKGDLSERVVEFVTPFRDRATELLEDDARLDAILAEGTATAHAVAQRTLTQVYERVGFGTPGG